MSYPSKEELCGTGFLFVAMEYGKVIVTFALPEEFSPAAPVLTRAELVTKPHLVGNEWMLDIYVLGKMVAVNEAGTTVTTELLSEEYLEKIPLESLARSKRSLVHELIPSAECVTEDSA